MLFTSTSFQTLLAYMLQSSALQLYVASMLIFVCGLLYEVWHRSIHVSFLNKVSLEQIERTHPHLPSTSTLTALFLCVCALFIVGFHRYLMVSPLRDPVIWMVIIAIFIGSAGFVVWGELHSKHAREYFFSYLIGHASALFFITSISFIYSSYINLNWWMICVLLYTYLLAMRLIWSSWSMRGMAITILSFFFWAIFLW